MNLFCSVTHSYGCYRPPSLSLSATHSGDTILLYKNTQTQTKFFRFIFFMSGVQLVFWAYLSYFAFAELRQGNGPPTPHSSLANEETMESESSNVVAPVSSAPWYSSLKWRLTISLSALGLGTLFATTACMYPLRVVQRLTYVRGKRGEVGITTFSPFKGTKEVRVDLRAIRVAGSRVDVGKTRQLGMKVKGHRLFYLLDREGEFPSPNLFDTLVGARRL